MIDVQRVLFAVITVIYVCSQIYLIIQLLLSDRDVTSLYSWILVLIVFPFIGMGIYILFGRYKKEFNIMDKTSKKFIENDLHSIFEPLVLKQKEYLDLIENSKTLIQEKKIAKLSQNNSSSLVTFNNEVDILQNGKVKFPKLLEDIRAAKKFIHMEYYTWDFDTLTKEIFEILKTKAKEGVEVRILYDAIGSYTFSLHWKYIRSLRKAGIEIYPFLRILHVHAWNYRNHRKIAVIDGEVGYIGGMNIGKEYIDGGTRFNIWRDTHLKIKGDAVNLLQRSFAIMWHITTGKSIGKKYFSFTDLSKTEKTPVQVLLSGPDSDSESIKQLYFGLITRATKRIFIQTPYFIPDSSMMEALIFAANTGIDVRIMVTGAIDVKLWGWAALTYLKKIVEAGGKVYLYQKGYLHSKVLIADGSISTVGTANFDIRSFRIDYEVNSVIYDVEISERLEEDFYNDIKDCQEYTQTSFDNLNLAEKIRNGLCKLLSPLL